ncbi:MAG: terminase, partial [Gammaproteobacteria bacterium]
LLAIDEAANIPFEEFQFLKVWSRSAEEGQRTRIILASNPPTDSTGLWLINMFRPWLDPDHHDPAEPGELRYFITVNDEDREVPDKNDVIIDGETYSPESRTFIPSFIDNNPFLMATGYKQTLQGLPKALRDRMLHGHFLSSMTDDEFQVIPSDWVEAAMDRWEAGKESSVMTSMGVDPSRGGADEMVISCRHGNWFAPLIKIPGTEVPNGPLAAARVVMARRDSCTTNVDSIGIGSSVVDKLNENGIDVEPMIGNAKTDEMSDDGLFKFKNLRAQWFWRLREMLDPQTGNNVSLPPDKKLKADLCAFTYKVNDGAIIQIESKKEAKLRLGRSPDAGDAVMYAANGMQSIHLARRGSKRFGVKLA